MSYQNFEAAMELAKSCDYYTTGGGKTQEEISRAEALLGVKFSPQCRAFYAKYGYLSFYGCEIFGIDPDHLDEMEGNSVACALHDRKETALPAHLIPIYNLDDGCVAYLDYASCNAEGEPRVVMAVYNGSAYEIMDTLAEDFGDFALRLVQENPPA